MTRIGLALALAAAVAACGNKSDSSGGAAASSSDTAAGFSQGTVDAAACNALVPAELKDKIVFEKRAIAIKRGHATTTYTVAAPKGWKQDMDAFADLKADDKGGFFSSFKVGTNCDGSCEPKDWDKVVDTATFAPLLKDAKVIKDTKGAGTRTVIVEQTNPPTMQVTTAWWKAGDKRYFQCEATLDESVKAAAPAFERACSALAVDGDD